MNELALFAGAGGGILGGKLLGWRTVCAVENEPHAAAILAKRQNEGILDTFPIWDDVCTFNGKPWKGIVDVVSGGFPCQDISSAGKGKGIEGEKSGLWKEFKRIIREVQSRYVFVENSPILTTRGINVVLGDLASLGYNARWGVLGASHVGAMHKRKRLWIVADSNSFKRIDTQKRCSEIRLPKRLDAQGIYPWGCEPPILGTDHAVASRVDRLKAIGNGQVPAVAALAWEILSGGIKK